MATASQCIADGSTLVGLVQSTATRLRAWVAASWLASASTTLTSTLDTATTTSALAGVLRTLARWLRRSFLYRWLTKEPEPDVIVIDLRETYAVGPFVALFDRLAPILGRTWRGSHAHRLLEALRTTSKRTWITDSRIVRLLAAALEPPEPPNENRRD
jgi:hypothetical protein